MTKKFYTFTLTVACLIFSTEVFAQYHANLYLTTDKGEGKHIGRVVFTDTDQGLNISYVFKDLPPGIHGFHIHENPSCAPITKDGKIEHAMAAGGHYDPHKTGKHRGPHATDGHRGDLPAITVKKDGTSLGNFTIGKKQNLKAAEFENRSIIIHANPDNYHDTPTPLGGSGPRIACGIIEN